MLHISNFHDYLLIVEIVFLGAIAKSFNPVYATVSDKWAPCH
jgi:hypothetical protein